MADTKISALTELDAAPDDADVLPIVDDPAGTPATKRITVENLRAGMALPVLHVRDEKSSGTSGGSSSATTWNVRDLNTVVTNQISGASLASNQITLPAGTYRVEAIAPSHRSGGAQLRIRNVTDGETELVGMAGFEGTEDNSSGAQHLRGRITLADTKVLELHHYTANAKATNGLGVAASSGEGEVYATVWVEKEA